LQKGSRGKRVRGGGKWAELVGGPEGGLKGANELEGKTKGRKKRKNWEHLASRIDKNMGCKEERALVASEPKEIEEKRTESGKKRVMVKDTL